jgi:hypothetical protein
MAKGIYVCGYYEESNEIKIDEVSLDDHKKQDETKRQREELLSMLDKQIEAVLAHNPMIKVSETVPANASDPVTLTFTLDREVEERR